MTSLFKVYVTYELYVLADSNEKAEDIAEAELYNEEPVLVESSLVDDISFVEEYIRDQYPHKTTTDVPMTIRQILEEE